MASCSASISSSSAAASGSSLGPAGRDPRPRRCGGGAGSAIIQARCSASAARWSGCGYGAVAEYRRGPGQVAAQRVVHDPHRAGVGRAVWVPGLVIWSSSWSRRQQPGHRGDDELPVVLVGVAPLLGEQQVGLVAGGGLTRSSSWSVGARPVTAAMPWRFCSRMSALSLREQRGELGLTRRGVLQRAVQRRGPRGAVREQVADRRSTRARGPSVPSLIRRHSGRSTTAPARRRRPPRCPSRSGAARPCCRPRRRRSPPTPRPPWRRRASTCRPSRAGGTARSPLRSPAAGSPRACSRRPGGIVAAGGGLAHASRLEHSCIEYKRSRECPHTPPAGYRLGDPDRSDGGHHGPADRAPPFPGLGSTGGDLVGGGSSPAAGRRGHPRPDDVRVARGAALPSPARPLRPPGDPGRSHGHRDHRRQAGNALLGPARRAPDLHGLPHR